MSPTGTETPDPTAVALPLAGMPIVPRLEELFESMSDAFVAYDAGWRLVQMNRAARAWIASVGVDPEEALGRVVWEVLPEAAASEFGRRMRQAMEQRVPVRFESPGPRSGRWAEIVAFPTADGLAALARDITDRKRAERAQMYDAERAARRRADMVLESITDGFASLDREWRFRYVNARAAEMAGATREALLGREFWELVPGAAETPLMTAMRRVMRDRTTEELESYSEVWGARWLDARVYPAEDGGISLFFRDITDGRRAREALHESESRLAAALDVASLGVWSVELRSGEVTISPRLREMLGIAPDDPRSDTELAPAAVHPDDRAAVREAFVAALARAEATGAGAEFRTEIRVLHTDGSTRWIAPIGQILCGTDGKPAQVVGVARDVTGRVLAEAERLELFSRERELRLAAERSAERTARLQRITALLAAALPRAEVASLVVDQVREAFDADTAWLAALSPDGRELQVLAELGYAGVPERRPRVPASLSVPVADVARDGQPRTYASKAELRQAYPHLGPRLDLVEQEALICLPLEMDGRTFGVMTLGFRQPRRFGADDVDFARALARQCAQALERARLYEAERAARAEAEAANRAKGQFLATMSHELRTPLNAIGGYIELMEMGIYGALTPEQRDVVARVQRSQRHLLSLINDVLNFARIEAGHVELSLRRVECDALLAGLEALVAPQVAAKGVALRSVPPAPGVAVLADEERLRQVLLNLLSNAIKFTPPGGSISVTAQGGDGAVRVRVADTGVGILPEHLERVFDPFVQVGRTLSVPHDGVGLGLAISRDLARAMGGDLHAESAPGAGSTFTLVLPAA
jgi:PAS domain S-box-containing protein